MAILFTLRAFARNLLKGCCRKKYFFEFLCVEYGICVRVNQHISHEIIFPKIFKKFTRKYKNDVVCLAKNLTSSILLHYKCFFHYQRNSIYSGVNPWIGWLYIARWRLLRVTFHYTKTNKSVDLKKRKKPYFFSWVWLALVMKKWRFLTPLLS